ncbi:MAG: hypothetical protein ACFCVA_06765, partial [Gammaproteobacteria bacterium]
LLLIIIFSGYENFGPRSSFRQSCPATHRRSPSLRQPNPLRQGIRLAPGQRSSSCRNDDQRQIYRRSLSARLTTHASSDTVGCGEKRAFSYPPGRARIPCRAAAYKALRVDWAWIHRADPWK